MTHQSMATAAGFFLGGRTDFAPFQSHEASRDHSRGFVIQETIDAGSVSHSARTAGCAAGGAVCARVAVLDIRAIRGCSMVGCASRLREAEAASLRRSRVGANPIDAGLLAVTSIISS